jgi:DHA2 family multidrug resistance protein
VPLTTLAFATLEPRFRADAAALFSLIRNIGSSVGISIVSMQLAHNIVVNRAEMAAKLTAGSPNLDSALGAMGDPATALAVLNAQVQSQAAFIAYLDDFKLMMLVTIACLPLLLLLRRKPMPSAGAMPVAAE